MEAGTGAALGTAGRGSGVCRALPLRSCCDNCLNSPPLAQQLRVVRRLDNGMSQAGLERWHFIQIQFQNLSRLLISYTLSLTHSLVLISVKYHQYQGSVNLRMEIHQAPLSYMTPL